jgi:hypothetical protein
MRRYVWLGHLVMCSRGYSNVQKICWNELTLLIDLRHCHNDMHHTILKIILHPARRDLHEKCNVNNYLTGIIFCHQYIIELQYYVTEKKSSFLCAGDREEFLTLLRSWIFFFLSFSCKTFCASFLLFFFLL